MASKSYAPPPTKKQIEFADEIARTLRINFPTCSKDFTKWNYMNFISDNINRFHEVERENRIDPEDEMAWWDPFAEGGY